MLSCKALPLASKRINDSRLLRQRFAELCRWEEFLGATKSLQSVSPAYEIAVRGVRALGPGGDAAQLVLPADVVRVIGSDVSDAQLDAVAEEICRLSDPQGVLPVSEQWRGIQGHLAKQLREYRDRQNKHVDSANAFAQERKEKLEEQIRRTRSWMQKATSGKDRERASNLIRQMEEEHKGLSFTRLYSVDPRKENSWVPSGKWTDIRDRIDNLLLQSELLLSSTPPPPPCAPSTNATVCRDSV